MYNQALAYLQSLKSAGIHPGLDTIRVLCAALGNPQDALPIIHVAGTNGKGSTCAYCAGILRAAGKRTGLFSSPYVLTLREMIQIDGQMIEESTFAKGVLELKSVCETRSIFPTEFEFLTALAFYLFAQEGVEVAVVEVGMGGALDSTNVVKRPAVCLLTHIALDHASFLGDTIEAVALQKCGIIKEGSAVVAFPNPAVEQVIAEAAEKKGASLRRFSEEDIQNLSVSLQGTHFSFQNQAYTAKMMGAHQAQNAVGAILATQALLGPLPHEILQAGLRVSLPARLEVVTQTPLLLLDGAHNPHGAQALAKTLKDLGIRELTAVTAMMADKDIQGILEAVAPFCKKMITTQVPHNPRSATAEDLAALAARFCPAEAHPDCFEALLAAKEEGQGVLVFGSLYLAEALKSGNAL